MKGVTRYHVVPGSDRVPVAGARLVGPAHPAGRVEVTVVLRPSDAEADRCADPADVAAIEEFAARHGLAVTAVNRNARSVRLAGTVEAMNNAFQVSLGEYEVEGAGRYRGRVGPVSVPEHLAP